MFKLLFEITAVMTKLMQQKIMGLGVTPIIDTAPIQQVRQEVNQTGIDFDQEGKMMFILFFVKCERWKYQ